MTEDKGFSDRNIRFGCRNSLPNGIYDVVPPSTIRFCPTIYLASLDFFALFKFVKGDVKNHDITRTGLESDQL
ncbi:MAG: hypothetical protein QG588_1628 [Candidatus Poribacteria bacterium]|nr:hypothetical protein [Candidatus Poribacteria bacterium]